MRTRNLAVDFAFKPYRVCPDCRAKYTTDRKTKNRAALIAVLALLTSGLSAGGLLAGFPLGIIAAVAGAGLLLLVGYTLSKMRYVEYRNTK